MGKFAVNTDLPSSVILDALATAILVVDPQLRVVRSNSAAQYLFSISDGRLCGEELLQHVRFPAEFEHRLQSLNSVSNDFIEREIIVLVPHSQNQICVDCAVISLGDQDSVGYHLLELTDRGHPTKAHKEAMLHAQQDASELLLRQLAHEIKNPLGGMRGAAQLLESELPDPALAEYTRIIVSEVDRLHSLIDRLSGPSSQGAVVPVNIHVVLEDTRQLLLSQQDHKVEIQCDYDPSIPPVMADQHWLEQIILNVAQNAAQAGTDGAQIVFKTRVQHAMTIRKERHKLTACIEITDNGPGIPEKIRDTLFYPMISGRDGGSGLGLAIAQGLVVRMGGLIEFDSTPGHTTFFIYIPLVSTQSGNSE